jgi:hypothetical protein
VRNTGFCRWNGVLVGLSWSGHGWMVLSNSLAPWEISISDSMVTSTRLSSHPALGNQTCEFFRPVPSMRHTRNTLSYRHKYNRRCRGTSTCLTAHSHLRRLPYFPPFAVLSAPAVIYVPPLQLHMVVTWKTSQLLLSLLSPRSSSSSIKFISLRVGMELSV